MFNLSYIRSFRCNPLHQCLSSEYTYSNKRNLLQLRGAQNHIHLAHTLIAQILNQGDTVVDATCGNGNDSLFLAKRIFGDQDIGTLYCMDIQKAAIEKTRLKLEKELNPKYMEKIHFDNQCHSSFSSSISADSLSAVVYNLGYLPGSDKTLITNSTTTIRSISNALLLLRKNGIISITCYRGHEGGLDESHAVESFLEALPSSKWSVYSHIPTNRMSSPILHTIYRNV